MLNMVHIYYLCYLGDGRFLCDLDDISKVDPHRMFQSVI